MIDPERLIAAEFVHTAARAGAIAEAPGNPFGAAAWRRDGIGAVRVRGIPSPWLNRATGLSDANAGHVKPLADWFGELSFRAETWADRAGARLSAALLAAGLRPDGGDAVVCGPPQPKPPTTIEDAGIDLFVDTHLAGLGLPPAVRAGAAANMRRWAGRPGWQFLLARRDGAPAGTCVLHVTDRLAYAADMATLPEWRRQGVQTELLAECHRRAAGLDAVWARCRFASQSHRNMARAGLPTLCTTVFWMR